MNELARELRQFSCEKPLSIDGFLARKPDGNATIIGFGEQSYKDKQGRVQIGEVFKVKELGGVRIWAAGTILLDQVIPYLKKKYGSVGEIDAALKANPQYWKFSAVIMTQDRKHFRPLTIYEEKPADFDERAAEAEFDEEKV